jgi:hypothetical protein
MKISSILSKLFFKQYFPNSPCRLAIPFRRHFELALRSGDSFLKCSQYRFLLGPRQDVRPYFDGNSLTNCLLWIIMESLTNMPKSA